MYSLHAQLVVQGKALLDRVAAQFQEIRRDYKLGGVSREFDFDLVIATNERDNSVLVPMSA